MYSIIKLCSLSNINYNSVILITPTGDMMAVNCRACAKIYIRVKPDELVQLKPFEETDCFKSFKFVNSNNLSIKKYLICFQVTQ